LARNASGGTPCAKDADEARKKRLAASSKAEERKRDADMVGPPAEVPTTLKHFSSGFGKHCVTALS
jgi:hypothetical protein